MSYVSVSTPFHVSLEFEVAPFVRRVGAWVADISVLLLYAYAMKGMLLAPFYQMGLSPIGMDLLLVSVPMLLYHLVMEVAFQGQSLGKKLMQVRVLSLEGGEPRLGQYLGRWIFRVWEWPLLFGFVALGSWSLIVQLLLTCMAGIGVVVIIAVTPRHQRLGDLIAGTAVVDLRSRYSLEDTIFREVDAPNYRLLFPEVMRLTDRDINAIKSVIGQTKRTGRYETAHRVSDRVKEVLQIQSDLEVVDFLEKLLEDYNYLATRGDRN